MKCIIIRKRIINLVRIYVLFFLPVFSKGLVIIKKGTFACASKGMILHFPGSATHAAYPEYGRNPAISIGNFLSQIPTISDASLYKDMILCTVIGVHVGDRAFGVAASEGEILLTILGEYEADMLELQENLHNKAKSIAKNDNLEINVKYCDEFPETENDNECLHTIEEKCEKHKIPTIEVTIFTNNTVNHDVI